MIFINYINLGYASLEQRLEQVFYDLEVSMETKEAILSFLNMLKIKDLATYEHSIRVGLVGYEVAKAMLLDEKALLISGLLHDIGKSLTDIKTLQKTEGWNEHDTNEIKKHVMDGYRLLRGKFDFSAEIIIWHHAFQVNQYPIKLPKKLHCYCNGTKVMIPFYGRILSLIDFYDALHRVNDKFPDNIDGHWIKDKLISSNLDQKQLIEKLYKKGVFTTNTW